MTMTGGRTDIRAYMCTYARGHGLEMYVGMHGVVIDIDALDVL